MEGLILFYKPVGWKNKDILAFFKRVFGSQKIGHSGTLDPFAEGLLVMGLGRKFTKQLHSLLLHSQKEYIAGIELGKTSDTFDTDGIISEANPAIKPDLKEIKSTIESKFSGVREQTPPVYSAKKFKGKRLRDLRDSEQIEEIIKTKTKNVSLNDFKIISYKYPFLKIKLSVSSGFYIRSFANDLGKELKTGAYLKSLERTAVGGFSADYALKPDDFAKNIELWGKLSGQVQGVGFRYFLKTASSKLNLIGYAGNNPDGTVEFVVRGNVKNIAQFQNFAKQGPAAAKISDYQFIARKQKNDDDIENFTPV